MNPIIRWIIRHKFLAMSIILGVFLAAMYVARYPVYPPIASIEVGNFKLSWAKAGQCFYHTTSMNATDYLQIGLSVFALLAMFVVLVIERREQPYKGFTKGTLEYNRWPLLQFGFLSVLFAAVAATAAQLVLELNEDIIRWLVCSLLALGLFLIVWMALFLLIGSDLDPAIYAMLRKRYRRNGILAKEKLRWIKPSDSAAQAWKALGPEKVEVWLDAVEILNTLAIEVGKSSNHQQAYTGNWQKTYSTLICCVRNTLSNRWYGCAAFCRRGNEDQLFHLFYGLGRCLYTGYAAGNAQAGAIGFPDLLSRFFADVLIILDDTVPRAQKAFRKDKRPGHARDECALRALIILSAIQCAAVDALQGDEVLAFYSSFQRRAQDVLSDHRDSPEWMEFWNCVMERLSAVIFARWYYRRWVTGVWGQAPQGLSRALSSLRYGSGTHSQEDLSLFWHVWCELEDQPLYSSLDEYTRILWYYRYHYTTQGNRELTMRFFDEFLVSNLVG